MKKFFISLVLVTGLIACTKPALERVEPAAKPAYFSKVKRYTDGRTPGVDTVWTLTLFNQAMVEAYKAQDGYIYNQTSTFNEVGVLWFK